MSDATTDAWNIEEASYVYHVDRWGDDYFFINDRGHAAVRPVYQDAQSIDIYEVVQEVRDRGIQLPCLIRFQDLLKTRVIELNEAFTKAITEFNYENVYRGVYPIKVNQLHEVVEEIIDAGEPYDFGLECGSKAELLACLAHLHRDNMLLVCNGYKDQTMLRLMMAGRQLGKNVLPVLEKRREFDDLMAAAEAMQVRPAFGVRVRLSSQGSGRWAESAGEHSKFGISLPKILELVDLLKKRDLSDSFQLLHFHLGSQISDILNVKAAVKEAARVYAKLIRMGLKIQYLDLGGGLGVSYEGTRSGRDHAINYTLQEYVNGVVYTVKEVCDAEDVPHPILVSESGRSLTAYHSVLVVGVLGATTRESEEEKNHQLTPVAISEDDHETVRELGELNTGMNGEMELSQVMEVYHDAKQQRQEANLLFSLGYLTLEEKAKVEQLFWRVNGKIATRIEGLDQEDVPEELRKLPLLLTDQYLCDFSIFQSILDHWAIDQVFPIMPLHRLDERPLRRGTLHDLTCDSDGKVDMFIDVAGVKPYLELHSVEKDESYLLGFFLMGAYQDILGDMHNLFGRVNEVHVYADQEEPSGFYIEKAIKGTTVEEVVQLVQYFPADLRKRMDRIIQQQVRGTNLRAVEGVRIMEQYNAALGEQTYYTYWPNEPNARKSKPETQSETPAEAIKESF